MSEDLLFLHANREYYETLDRLEIGSEFRAIIRQYLPPTWQLQRHSLWLHAANPQHSVPEQGFKIHVSSIPQHAEKVLNLIVPACVRRGTTFKCAADARLHRLLNSKPYDRGGSGKFMTIYPATFDAFKEQIDELHGLTAADTLTGPYILSDRRYKDSRVIYYRYGGLSQNRSLAVDGFKYPMITDPSGAAVRDFRQPYFALPAWVDDPFGGSRAIPDAPDRLIGGRFAVEALRSVSNRGGVYEATDVQTGAIVIVKEARPHIHELVFGGTLIEPALLLQREYRTLQRLQPLGCSPTPICLFADWEHQFLAQERLNAVSLREYFVGETTLLLPYIGRGSLSEFVPRFRTIAQRLLDIVDGIHGEGIIIGDMSHGNVMVDESGSRVWLIDLESATAADDDPLFRRFAAGWYTPGYRRPERSATTIEITREDDLYATAIVLFSTMFGGPAYLALEPNALPRLLAGAVGLGVPSAVAEAILALTEARLDRARLALARL